VEWVKEKALSSNPSTTHTQKKRIAVWVLRLRLC
jgi:hypothetical protein